MKLKILSTFVIASSCGFTNFASALEVKFSDPAWNGETIPVGQQCQKFGGENPASPALTLSEIPLGSDLIVLEYSDRDSKKMDNGGHGIMSYAIDNAMTNIDIPSVTGHSFDIPQGFTMIEKHRGAGWDIEGAYMPPCSGANNHAYYVTVKSMKGTTVTAEKVLEMGKY